MDIKATVIEELIRVQQRLHEDRLGMLIDRADGKHTGLGSIGSVLDIDRRMEAVSALIEKVSCGGSFFQRDVNAWLDECFGEEIAMHLEERLQRFFEECVEQVQSLGFPAERAHAIVEHTYSREPGEPQQEAGGVQVTHAALCRALELDAHECGQKELERIQRPVVMDKIRLKQQTKPQFGGTEDIYPRRPFPKTGKDVLERFVSDQRALGEAFTRVWNANVDVLYEDERADRSPPPLDGEWESFWVDEGDLVIGWHIRRKVNGVSVVYLGPHINERAVNAIVKQHNESLLNN